MSAMLNELPPLASMRAADLDEVVAIEAAIYTHPWSRGNFADSLASGYACTVWREGGREDGALLAYCVVMVGAGDAHLLNLSVAANAQRRGYGGTLLGWILRDAREAGASTLFLEVRPSNTGAQALYRRFGFRLAGVRRGYYPAHGGREDALVFMRDLTERL
ncbi:MAG TPA: ribosomal protein S18-alanine N-acetyltransferase [Burkholderiales bacterium]